MTISRGIWVPGQLVATNEALSLARAAGYYEGRGRAMVETGRWRDYRGGEDRYATSARSMRTVVCALARAARLPPAEGRVRLRFRVHGYPRWDPAAVYLAAKWAEDGLVDAGVIRDDSRQEVAEASVAVCAWDWGLNPGPGIYVGWESVQ